MVFIGALGLVFLWREKDGEPRRINSKELEAHDFIELPSINKAGISEKVIELYRSGLTMRQVARRMGWAKSTVRATLLAAGVELRPSCRDYQWPKSKVGKPYVGVAPYGFYCLRGKLFADPKEIETLRLILTLWRSGQSLSAIVRHLSHHRIKTRKGSVWMATTIRTIVQRHEVKSDILEEILWESKN
ncbi:MAG: recombinase family protein [Deltaproteobacteria bacterium]|nr:recombinase family protein [Deltaproteobacteria bacterium]